MGDDVHVCVMWVWVYACVGGRCVWVGRMCCECVCVQYEWLQYIHISKFLSVYICRA